MRKIAGKIQAMLLAGLIILAALPVNTYASGSFSVSSTSLTITQGSSKTVTLTATNAVGAFEISTDGGVSASCSSEKWVDCSSASITVTGNTVGTGHVYITIYDGADYDGNDLSGKSFTITVTVSSASGGTVSETTTQSQTAATTKATTTTTQTTTEETTVDPEIELLTVTVDEESFLVVKDLSDLDIPEGFEIEETTYNTVTVQTFVCEDVVIYVLEDEDGDIDYYTLSGGTFSLLKYVTLNGRFCIFLDMPENLEIPYGYALIETEIYGYSVEALVYDEELVSDSESLTTESQSAADEDSAEGEDDADVSGDEVSVDIKAYYTVLADTDGGAQEAEDTAEAEEAEDEEAEDEEAEDEEADVTTVSEMVDSTEGHYYVYCMLNGQKVLCDYDSNDNILQRCTALFEIETEAAVETEVAEDITDIEEDDVDINMILLIDVIIACGIIVILVIVLIIVLVVKRKKKSDPDDIDDLMLEEEDLFEDELDDFTPVARSFYAEAVPSLGEEGEPDYEQSPADNDEEIIEEEIEEKHEGEVEEEAEETPETKAEEVFESAESAKEESPLQEEVKEEYNPEDVDFALDIESFFEEEIETELGFEKEALQEEAGEQSDPFEEIQKAIDSVSMPAESQEGFSVEMEIDDLSDILGDEFEEV